VWDFFRVGRGRVLAVNPVGAPSPAIRPEHFLPRWREEMIAIKGKKQNADQNKNP
jgi:hypothetical protein